MSLPEVCVVYLLRPRSPGFDVLVGRKLTGFGRGKLVAPGGKLESGESPIDAAVREVREETGILVESKALELVGDLTYVFTSKPEWSQRSWAFRAIGDFGSPRPTVELDAFWIHSAELPVGEMWDDARYWVRDAIDGASVAATFQFGDDLSSVVASDHPGFRS